MTARFIFNSHLLVALIFGAFITVIAVTGCIVAFEPELDRAMHADLAYVRPGARTLTLTEIAAAVKRVYRDEPVVAFIPSLERDASWEVVLPPGVVVVNPYTGNVLGMRTRGQTLLGRIRGVQVGLAGGPVGRSLVKWSTVATVPLLLTGIYLWWPRKRFWIQGSVRTRRFWVDLHDCLGMSAGLLVLMLAATGVAMVFSDEVRPYLYEIAGAPDPVKPLAAPERLGGPYLIDADRAVVIAMQAVPNAAPHMVQMPAFGGRYVVNLTDPSDRLTGERHSLIIDPHSGDIVQQRGPAQLASVDRLMVTITKLHLGSLFGTTGRVAVSIASLLVVAMVLSGVIMLWFRTIRSSQSFLR